MAVNQNDDFINSLYHSVNSFISSGHKILINYENNGININKMFYDFTKEAINTFETKNKYICGELNQKEYNLLQEYNRCQEECHKLIMLIKLSEKSEYCLKLIENKMDYRLFDLDHKLQSIIINNKNKFIDINKYFNQIEIIKNKLEGIKSKYDLTEIHNIALNVKQLTEIIITNCLETIEFYKKTLSYIGSNIIASQLYIYNKLYNNYEYTITKILKNAFEQLLELNDYYNYDDYINKIKLFHKYAIGLHDKLTIIMEMNE
jgi:hypothetical protein